MYLQCNNCYFCEDYKRYKDSCNRFREKSVDCINCLCDTCHYTSMTCPIGGFHLITDDGISFKEWWKKKSHCTHCDGTVNRCEYYGKHHKA